MVEWEEVEDSSAIKAQARIKVTHSAPTEGAVDCLEAVWATTRATKETKEEAYSETEATT